jgi:RES domain
LSRVNPFEFLKTNELRTKPVTVGSKFVRVHLKGVAPLRPSEGPSRFSDPLKPETLPRRFCPLYMAKDYITAFGETLVRERRDYGLDDPLTITECEAKHVTTIEANSDLTLLLLDEPTRMHIPTNTVRASDDVTGRDLAEAVWRKFPHIHGFWYPSRLTTRPCIMIFDRRLSELGIAETEALMDHPEFGAALDYFDVPLV